MRAGLLQDWIHTSDQKMGFRFDRCATIGNNKYYFEVERGTHTLAAIQKKVEQYLKLPGRFHVIFTVQDYRANPFAEIDKTGKQFGAEILTLLQTYKRGSQFLVAPHHLLLENPHAQLLVSPENKAYSFQSLVQNSSMTSIETI